MRNFEFADKKRKALNSQIRKGHAQLWTLASRNQLESKSPPGRISWTFPFAGIVHHLSVPNTHVSNPTCPFNISSSASSAVTKGEFHGHRFTGGVRGGSSWQLSNKNCSFCLDCEICMSANGCLKHEIQPYVWLGSHPCLPAPLAKAEEENQLCASTGSTSARPATMRLTLDYYENRLTELSIP